MRRLLAIAVAVLGLGTFLLVATGAQNGSEGGYRVDAIFDSASFLIPGQDVKIAGARVGEVADVTLTPQNKARIQMRIDPRFAPFRDDASCTIQPQSLIGEKFLQCTPGTPRGRELVAQDGEAPTVPLENTSSPVDLDLVFSTFRRPTNERLAILVNELGAGLAGRGEDLNAAIRRANPALLETRRVLRIANADRRRLRALVRSARVVADELARRRGRVQDVVDRAGSVTRVTAERRADLEAAVRDLPALLREAEPALRDLQGLAGDGTPLLTDLRRAAPELVRLAKAAPPLAEAARPALTRIGSAAEVGGDALTAAKPVITDLRRFARAALPTGRLLNELLQSLRTSGTVEGLQDFAYYAALTTSRFDKTSHIIPAHLLLGECSAYATRTVASCDANFAGGGNRATTAKARAKKEPKRAKAQPKGAAVPGTAAPDAAAVPGTAAPDAAAEPGTAAPAPAAPEPPALKLPGLPPIELPDVLGGGDGERESLLEYLLR